MTKVYIFLFLHALADYPLQGDFLAKFKGSNWMAMIAHCLIWAGMIFSGLIFFEMDKSWHFPFLFFGHMVIDKWKCSRSGNGKELGSDLIIDQTLHFAQVFTCLFWS